MDLKLPSHVAGPALAWGLPMFAKHGGVCGHQAGLGLFRWEEEAGAVTFFYLRIRNASENSRAHTILAKEALRNPPLVLFLFLNHSGLSSAILKATEVTAQAGVKKSIFVNEPLKGLYLNSR